MYDDGWGRNRHALTALGRRQTAVSSPFLASLNTRGQPCAPPRGAPRPRAAHAVDFSSTKFSAAWLDTLSVLVARGRAQVGVAAATADWPKRIRDMRYADQEDRGTAD